ncbi:MAG: DUF924 domain-containing protein [Alphaproteobacteria bacterium]|nr:DUF924 domain-containing protein [Alphaproteobacteria bacterium]
MVSEAQDVLDFWFLAEGHAGHNARRDVWFKKDDAFDASIRTRFGTLVERALSGASTSWTGTKDGALALIIVLDQFTRNAFRDTPRAFAGDSQALILARNLVASGAGRALPGVRRLFVYLPFEHAENLETQNESLRLFQGLAKDEPPLADLLIWAERHHAIVARFGRFPHRNAILGRVSTPEEEAFLREPGSSF